MLAQVRALLKGTRSEVEVADAQQIAAMERQAEADKLEDDAQLAKAVAAAECAMHGHIPPPILEVDPDADFVPWGLSSPFKKAPSCQRCGSELAESRTRDV